MGVFTDFVTNRKTFSTSDRVAEQAAIYGAQAGDPADTGAAANDEVQTIAFDAAIAGGTFTLTIGVLLSSGVRVNDFTTAAIARTANAATIEAAIDTASPATVANGAISVSGGPITTADIVLTFDGATVSGINQPLAVLTSSLTDGMDPIDPAPVVVQTTAGEASRAGWSILKKLGVITNDPPESGVVLVVTPGANLLLVKPWFIKAVAREIAKQDNNDAVYAGILRGLGMSDTQGPVV